MFSVHGCCGSDYLKLCTFFPLLLHFKVPPHARKSADTVALQRLNLHYGFPNTLGLDSAGLDVDLGYVNHLYVSAMHAAINRAALLQPTSHFSDQHARKYRADSTALAWLPNSIPLGCETPLSLSQRLNLIGNLLPLNPKATTRSRDSFLPFLCAVLLYKAAVVVVHTNTALLQLYSTSMLEARVVIPDPVTPTEDSRADPTLATPIPSFPFTLISVESWTEFREIWLQPMMRVTASVSTLKTLFKKTMGLFMDTKVWSIHPEHVL